MPRSLDIAIVGYGTAGQAAAIALSRDGHRLHVFERAAELGPVGAGFLLQPAGQAVLWELGLLEAARAHGARIDRLHGETARGRAVMDMRYPALDARFHGLGMQRGALFRLLCAAWPDAATVRRGCGIVAASEDGRRIRDTQGREHGPFDLVVAADGSASRLRDAVGGARLDRPYPWGALWCLVPAAGWPHLGELRQRYVGARRMVGLLPVGTRPDDPLPRLSFFWSLRADAFEAWAEAGMDAWHAELAALWPEAAPLLAGLDHCSLLARARYRDAVLPRWHRGRLVLAGDAAHAMSPQLGQGVNMALLDALALRDALRAEDDPDRAIARYQHVRRAHVGIYQFWSRWLTPVFQSDRDRIARLRDLAFLPMGRMPVARGQMLRVLSGTQRGMFGRLALPEGFLRALAEAPA
ncbi:FAD-dependent oxidoreductase [Coralloluteibacterium stylophorae]|uniref:FAD-dependent monooxygenase n=1 Tax=Coralloluteibacterium stylophorae TaxID=1776034 RepID=A0A8J8AW86_9GAMM|nr:NAD(P)/FAD-dependent oxidoreductase [Coralloluteibacterium stylophorae]MBS7456898.1 FAD-dependent monooxygenase [Coralloluteibacterium stylophorae]